MDEWLTCVCFSGRTALWTLDVVMSIRPSSSTGVLFALVSNGSVPLSVAVVTRGPDDAVSRVGYHLNFIDSDSYRFSVSIPMCLKKRFRYQTYLFCVSFCKTFICCWIPWTKISRLHKNWTQLRAVCVQIELCFWTNLLNEWFSDSLKIDSFHYWMNQCFWMNLLNEWFSDSLKIDSFHYWMNQCFWMNLLNEWFNDSLKIDSFHYWMNQCFWMNLLNEWFNDSLKIDSFHYWMNQCL